MPPRYARRRDLCEEEIVRALKAAGCSVAKLEGTGLPDLLVGWRGRNFLLECKDEHGKAGQNLKRTADGLRDTQRTWFGAWKGAPICVVTCAAEAYAAIGLVTDAPP